MTTPVQAMRAFIDSEFPESRTDVYYHAVNTAMEEGNRKKIQRHYLYQEFSAIEAAFTDTFDDTCCDQFEALKRALSLRAAIEFHLWAIIDPDELAWFEKFLQQGEAEGLSADAFRAGRAKRVDEVRAALPIWEALRSGAASNAAIKAHSSAIWLEQSRGDT